MELRTYYVSQRRRAGQRVRYCCCHCGVELYKQVMVEYYES